jgi:hypothetical protein
MGYVIVELPCRVKRRYKLTDAEQIESLLEILDSSAARLKDNPALFLTSEDILDIKAAKAVKKEKGVLPWEDVKAGLDL